MKLLTVVASMLLFQPLMASTFIGNGGNAGDVELQVTLSQITNTLTHISQLSSEEQETLCSCEKILEQHKVCESLSTNNQRQANYCADQTVAKANEILHLIKNRSETLNTLHFDWTARPMEVSEKTGEREADAIANSKNKKIILNRERFLKLKDYERIYLVMHELGHLIQFDKKYLSDDEPFGPFKQDDGGRKFLNSMAAAVTMKSLSTGQVSDFKQVLTTSKSYKENWLSVSLGQETNRTDQSRFAIEKYKGWDLQYRHQLNQSLGLSLGGRRLKGDDHFLTTTKAETELNFLNIQLNYRLFPSANPLSSMGQSHFVLGLGVETGTVDFKVYDDYVSETASANLLSPILSGQYFLAMNSGIWFNGGITVTNHKYTFNNIGLGGYQSDSNQIYLNIGAAYGF